MVHQARATFQGGIDAYPVAPMQQGMLYHALQGRSSVDVQQVICELNERIDPAHCEQAWQDVSANHTVLRTGFEWIPSGEPRQVVNPPGHQRVPFRRLDYGNAREAQQGLAEYLEADRMEGFRTLTGPLLRVALIRGGEKHAWLVTTYHHLLMDARSLTLLFREVLDRHDARASGTGLDLPPDRPYRDFVDWLQTQDPASSLDFWRDHLRGLTVPTAAPAAHASSGGGDGDSGTGELMFRISPATTTRLREFAGREGVTLNTVVQAAWALVLNRYTGQDDIVFGALRAGRRVPIAGADTILGLFINTVPVRVRFTPDLRVSSWLRSLRAAWVAMRPHEHTPLSIVQRCSGIPSDRRLFETLLNFQEPAWDEALTALGGKWAERHFDIRSHPNYPLALDVYSGAALTTKCFYEIQRFDAPVVARLLGHFRGVLESLAADPVERVADLPLLSVQDHEQLLAFGRGAEMELPGVRCVHDLVARHARSFPHAPAVSCGGTLLTYQQLNTQANRLAHRLLHLGVTQETPVAVCMERSAEMLVAWLGVLKAGAAFVPLDPAYPADRLTFQLEDCRASVVLVQTRTRPSMGGAGKFAQVIEVAVDEQAFRDESSENPPTKVGSSDLAYIIYTSGSTGQPKGVQIEHGALGNLVTWHQRTYAVTSTDRATQLASPAFDASIWEIWPYLTAGASVHIPSEETRVSPALLWRWLADQQITLSFMPTPLAEAVLREEPVGSMALRALLTGGDRLQARPPSGFPCPLINHYGPTESTVVATFGEVPGGDAGSAPTIGRPIANTNAWILDNGLRLVPAGVAGELCLSGASLARGYLRRPELNAEKFVTVTLTPGAAPVRVYRTGDLVRWTAAGELEFLGRIDSQVKIRGYRIELGEIEANLQTHPAVRESVVLARADDRGESRLVGYIVLKDAGSEVGEGDLIAHLRARLPAYMVPAAIVRMVAWPLTANGKIDRKNLPEPALSSAGAETRGSTPISATELLVAKTWSDVLGRRVMSNAENFFDLGGHSLLAAQVVARLNATLPSSLSVRVLFDHPTLSAFAREVDHRLGTAALSPRPVRQRLQRRNGRAALELTPPN